MRLLQTTVLLTVLGASSIALTAADAPPEGRRGQAGRPGGPLGLDEKQRELLREAMMKDEAQIRPLEEKLRSAQKELVNAALAEKFDEAAVRQKAEALAKIQTDITVLRAKAFSSIAPTLKPEQREQLATSPFGAAILGGRLGGGGPGFGPGRGGDAAPGGPGGRRRAPEGQ